MAAAVCVARRVSRAGVAARTTAACIAVTVLAVAFAVAIGVPDGVSTASRAPALRPLHFPASFAPQQITAADGSLWILGSHSPSTFTDCALWKVDPSTMATQSFALPQCATGITSGNGRVYLLVDDFQSDSSTRNYQVEVFDTATGATQVLSPVVLQNVGSAVAHTDFTFGDGLLWLYGYALGGRSEVVRISPDTGAPESTIDNPPQIGGIFPAVVADAAGVWLAGGPGGTAQLQWVHAGTGSTTSMPLVSGGRTGSILWLSAVAGRIWAGVARYGGAPGTTTLTTRLVALTGDGNVAVRSPWGPIGLFPLVAARDGQLWDVEYSQSCGGPEHLVEVSASTGVSRPTVPLAAPSGACYDEDGGSELAALGRDVFVLLGSGSGGAVLYRATT